MKHLSHAHLQCLRSYWTFMQPLRRMATNQVYDCVVVGGGIEGSNTALYLARNGKRTLLLEQFSTGHNHGSSHGLSRIIRYAYVENFYIPLMKQAYEEWKRIEKESGNSIYIRTGFLAIEKTPHKNISAIATNLQKNGCKYEMLTGSMLKTNYPQLQFDDDLEGICDPEGGILLSDKALSSIQKLFIQNGGIIKDKTTVTNILPGDEVTLVTSHGNFVGRSVVLCPGPWAGDLLKTLELDLPLTVQRVSVNYWEEKEKGTYSHKCFPVFKDFDTVEVGVFGLPSFEYPGLMKLCLHHGPVCHPNTRDLVTDTTTVPMLTKYIKEHFPGLKPEPAITDACLYTVTPDEVSILDHHPLYKNIVMGVGFSGTGFKLGPVVGQILGDLAIGNPSKFNIDPFSLKRFPLLKSM